MPWMLRSPSRLSVVQGLGSALGLAAGWGWAGAAQVGAGWAAGARVEEARARAGTAAEGRVCRCHLRGIIRAVAASPVGYRPTGILQRRVMLGIAALAPASPRRMPVCPKSLGDGKMHEVTSGCTSLAANCATGKFYHLHSGCGRLGAERTPGRGW